MPLPWKKRKNNGVSRLSRVLSDFQTPKTRSSFVVETGFPTSVVDLFVKNRNRLKKQSKKKKETREISEVFGVRIEAEDDDRNELLSSDRTHNVENPDNLKNRCASVTENRNSDCSSELLKNRCDGIRDLNDFPKNFDNRYECDQENRRIDKHMVVCDSSNETFFSADMPVPVDNTLENWYHRRESPTENPSCKQLGIEELSIADRRPIAISGEPGNNSVFNAVKIMDNFNELQKSVMFVVMMIAFTTKKLSIGTSAFLLILLGFLWGRLVRTVRFLCSAQIFTRPLPISTYFFSKPEEIMNREDDEANVTSSCPLFEKNATMQTNLDIFYWYMRFGCPNMNARIVCCDKESSRSKRIRSKIILKLMPKKLRDIIKENLIQRRETNFDRREEQHETYKEDDENLGSIEKRVEFKIINCSMFVMVVLAGLIGGRVLALALTVVSGLISPLIVRHWR